jgi:hypothetical protein
MGYTLAFAALLALFRYSSEAVATYGQALADICVSLLSPRDVGGQGSISARLPKWSDGADESRLAEMRRGLAIVREQGYI